MSNSRTPVPGGNASIPVTLKRAGDAVSKLCLALSAVAIFVIIGINAGNVAFRHLFGFAWSWAEEAMLFAMIFGVFAGSTSAAWRGSHMHFDMFLGYLPPRWRTAAIVFTGILGAGVLLILANASYRVVSLLFSFGQTSIALGFPMWIAQGCVLAGFVLIAVMMVLRLAASGAALSHLEADGAAEQKP